MNVKVQVGVEHGMVVRRLVGSPDGAAARSLELLRAASAKLIDLTPAGHWPFFDQPNAFAEAVATMLVRFSRPHASVT